MLCDIFVLKTLRLELLRCVQLRLVTLRQVTFTLCCFTLCSNIVSGRQTSNEVVHSLTHTQLHSHPNISPLLQLLPGGQSHILIIWKVFIVRLVLLQRGSGPCLWSLQSLFKSFKMFSFYVGYFYNDHCTYIMKHSYICRIYVRTGTNSFLKNLDCQFER
jgi:hypothetical protein